MPKAPKFYRFRNTNTEHENYNHVDPPRQIVDSRNAREAPFDVS